MKTQSYVDFTHEYYSRFPNSSYSLGQFFLCRFFKDSSLHCELWNEKDNRVAEDMIYKLILQYNWDLMNLQIVNEGV